ncbi:hypothetical protein [Flavobacterium tistrianum]|uniref:hypothetical protein n=1 Tax=Flavobacterium tistrianum TaxID=1685414 RepID=UPI000DACA63E|nr:hypothetical protein [Flavobacterium tistrianum]KAF2340922.1 hypothetical protein DMB71_11150 [Flavobacterium tistrianum]
MPFNKIKVYHLFWIVSILVLIIGFIKSFYPNSFLDINIHDTYYIISNLAITASLFFLYFFMGSGYWLIEKVFKKQLTKPLTVIHSIILIGSFMIYWFLFLYYKLIANNDFSLADDSLVLNLVLILEIFVILFVATPIYIANFMMSFLRKE